MEVVDLSAWKSDRQIDAIAASLAETSLGKPYDLALPAEKRGCRKLARWMVEIAATEPPGPLRLHVVQQLTELAKAIRA